MLIFYGAPARLPAYDTTPSACHSYTLVNLNREPPLRLQTDIPIYSSGLVDLCCGIGDPEDPCYGANGLYLEGREVLMHMSFWEHGLSGIDAHSIWLHSSM